jgi:hypothetical protein
LEVLPKEPTTFTLVVDENGKIRTQSARVEIEGAKGDSLGPDFHEFSGGITGQEYALGFVQFESFAFKILQDQMKFKSVQGEFVPDRPYHILYTEKEPRPELAEPTEAGVRKRRIAYAVTIYMRSDDAKPPCRFEVKSLIEYQLWGESKWHPEEDDSALAGQRSAALKDILQAPQPSGNG